MVVVRLALAFFCELLALALHLRLLKEEEPGLAASREQSRPKWRRRQLLLRQRQWLLWIMLRRVSSSEALQGVQEVNRGHMPEHDQRVCQP